MWLSNLAAYSAQVVCVAAAGGLLVALLRIESARARYGIWRTLLAICLLLPWLQGRQTVAAGRDATVGTRMVLVGLPAAQGPASESSLPVSAIVIAVLAGGVAVRGLWMSIGLLRLGRLRTAGVAAPPDGAHADAARAIGAAADIRFVPNLRQPVTFGVRRAVVLLPEALRACPEDIQRAVVCHELQHVRRRDWIWLVGEEGVRTALWFHPAIWWLVSRVQLAREEVVDDLVVRVTGDRRSYVKALLTFADEAPLSPAPAFARKRHLFRRMQRISKETVMSTKRIVLSCAVMALLITGGTWLATGAFPLSESVLAQGPAGAPGPLERRAKPITPENPVPRRTYRVLPDYPPELVSANLDAILTARVTIDNSGRVAEARIVTSTVVNAGNPATRPPGTSDAAFRAAVDAAVRQWQYDPPADGPIAFPASFRFLQKGGVVELAPAAADPAVPSWHAGALRVGDGILPPKKIKDVRPEYPLEAQDARVQGIVILEVRIETDGRVSETRVLRSIPALDQAAIDAVKQWEFEPTTTAAGDATPIIMVVTVMFTLS